MEYFFVIFVLIPLAFLALAKLLIKLLPFLEESFKDTNSIIVWLKKNNHIYNVKWLSNKLEMIFWLSLIILMVGLTVIYS